MQKDHSKLWSFCEFPFRLKEMAGAEGLEPTTNGFGDRDSTN